MSLYTNYSRPYRCKENTNATVNLNVSAAGEQTIYIKIKNKTTNAFVIRFCLSVTLDAPITKKN
jgi:hypothetical protein